MKHQRRLAFLTLMDCHIKLCFLAALLSRASHLGPDNFSRKNLCVRGELLEMQPFKRKVKKKKCLKTLSKFVRSITALGGKLEINFLIYYY